ncbi:hypothetical protein BKA70DRAFT_1420798 [Coprinopsis sp. MPI-PUGE-AT-0042]|nr:hypothetical protein BKA70DRAFT_1420798 [Coprinopsis sp. MPI-PUGE-AT-0042]
MRLACLNRAPHPSISQDDMENGKQWVMNYYTALDTSDPSFVSTFFTSNASIVYGSTTATGTQSMNALVDWQRRATLHIDHCITAIHVLHEQLLVQTSATYTLRKGEQQQVNSMTAFNKAPSHKKATRASVYSDFTALFNTFATIAGPLPPPTT